MAEWWLKPQILFIIYFSLLYSVSIFFRLFRGFNKIHYQYNRSHNVQIPSAYLGEIENFLVFFSERLGNLSCLFLFTDLGEGGWKWTDFWWFYLFKKPIDTQTGWEYEPSFWFTNLLWSRVVIQKIGSVFRSIFSKIVTIFWIINLL